MMQKVKIMKRYLITIAIALLACLNGSGQAQFGNVEIHDTLRVDTVDKLDGDRIVFLPKTQYLGDSVIVNGVLVVGGSFVTYSITITNVTGDSADFDYINTGYLVVGDSSIVKFTCGDTGATQEYVDLWLINYLDSADNHIGDTATVLRAYSDAHDVSYLDSADNHIGDTATVLRAYADAHDVSYLDSADNHIGDTATVLRAYADAHDVSYLDSADNHIGDTATVLRAYSDAHDVSYLDSADNHIGDTATILRAYSDAHDVSYLDSADNHIGDTATVLRAYSDAHDVSYLDSADNHIGDTATVLRAYTDAQDVSYLDSADNHIGDTATVLRAYADAHDVSYLDSAKIADDSLAVYIDYISSISKYYMGDTARIADTLIRNSMAYTYDSLHVNLFYADSGDFNYIWSGAIGAEGNCVPIAWLDSAGGCSPMDLFSGIKVGDTASFDSMATFNNGLRITNGSDIIWSPPHVSAWAQDSSVNIAIASSSVFYQVTNGDSLFSVIMMDDFTFNEDTFFVTKKGHYKITWGADYTPANVAATSWKTGFTDGTTTITRNFTTALAAFYNGPTVFGSLILDVGDKVWFVISNETNTNDIAVNGANIEIELIHIIE